MIKWFFLKLIRFYQKVLSPDQGIFSFLKPGGTCRFHPTCSEYCYQSIQKYGTIKGISKGIKRILRCHPWSRGGTDRP